MDAWFLTPGILADPGWSDGWTDKAATWLQKRGLGHAEKVEPPKQFPVLRHFSAGRRAREFAAKVREYAYDAAAPADRIILVGHSNGGVTITDALKEPVIRADVVNLIAPACERDFEKNGLANAMRFNRVGRVNIWISGHDQPLVLAKWSKILFGWTGYSFGTLGLYGPKNHESFGDRVRVHHKPDFQHGTYWDAEIFPGFMQELIAASK